MKIKKNELLFCIAFSLYMLYRVVFINSNYLSIVSSKYRNIVLYISYFLFIIKIVTEDKLDIKSLIVLIIFITIGIVVYYYNPRVKILELVLILYSARNIDFKIIAKTTLIELIILILFVIVSAKVGIIENYLFLRSDGLSRQALGFVYVSKLPVFFLEMVFLYCYLKETNNSKITLFNEIIIIIISLIIYYYTNVRNSLILTILLLILIKVFSKNLTQTTKKNIFRISVVVFLLCFSLSLYLSYNYDPSSEIYTKINKILSGRLSVTNKVSKQYPISLFGNDIEMHGSSSLHYGNEKIDYNYVDSAYVQLLLTHGIAYSFFFWIMYLSVLRYSVNHNKRVLFCWLIVLFFSSIVDDTAISLTYNCSLIFMFQTIYNNYKSRRKLNENSNSRSNI